MIYSTNTHGQHSAQPLKYPRRKAAAKPVTWAIYRSQYESPGSVRSPWRRCRHHRRPQQLSSEPEVLRKSPWLLLASDVLGRLQLGDGAGGMKSSASGPLLQLSPRPRTAQPQLDVSFSCFLWAKRTGCHPETNLGASDSLANLSFRGVRNSLRM